MPRRALHYVLKIGNLKKNVEFFRDRLGMKVLRHEVFEKGCDAACNGPYDGKWSKTMIGYGPEDNHFVLELTYNYSVGSYRLGNDLQYIKLALNEDLYNRFQSERKSNEGEDISLSSPDGYKFILMKNLHTKKQDIVEVCVSISDTNKSINYWVDLLGMTRLDSMSCPESIFVHYDEHQAVLKLKHINNPIDRASAYGRIAFSCQSEELKQIQKKVEEAGHKVLTPYLSLETPGKATVQVVILADPDELEICFVGDEGFRELSQVDPLANSLIEKSILEDKSDEWFEKRKITKPEA